MDFTIKTYEHLLTALKESGYIFQTFAEFIESPAEKAIVLRHDVDAKKWNSYRFAKIQAGMEIKGTYYFRMISKSFSKRVIREIATMGHEIGYHYETMNTSGGDVDEAYVEFCRKLEIFRKLVPIKTICMHGSPLSKYDNRSIWQKYNYKDLGIIGEPYFDIDFNKVLYLTDTGRRWNGDKVSFRDKVSDNFRHVGSDQAYDIRNQKLTQNSKLKTQNLTFRSTKDIITAAEAGTLPDQMMFTFHPQRWTDKPFPWLKELVWQNIKNQVKRILVK